MTAAGLDASGHALLGAALATADGDEQIFSARLSARTVPWLADHAVGGTVLVPGAAFADMAVHAARETGCDLVEELTMTAPLRSATRGDDPAGPG
ncbi:hypothetical protein, partial [Actinomadura sp. CNU-125]|uniref:hypothetical protein n=1 Tax=Actinomadura sp. CNU-125 TaxID=1904961 RepID=UPI0039677631